MPPGIGYDPRQYSPTGAGAQTIEQWAADMASQYTVAYANGNGDAFNQFPNAFSDQFWATLGLPPLPDESFGATAANPNNVINPGVYSGLSLFFNQLATNPQSAQSAGITVPQLPSGGIITDDLGRSHLYGAEQAGLDRQNNLDAINATNAGAMARDAANNQFTAGENAANRAFSAGENAADRAQQMAIANLQESGMNQRSAAEIAARMSIAQLQEAGESARNAARIAADIQMNSLNNETQRYGIDTNATVAREDLAGRERIAGADRTSRETIASEDRQESARQFDLNIGEDRRQFNATMLFELFDRGVELVKNPVDWIAYQYYLENLSIPMTALNVSSMAANFGAVPETGPSEMGPMVGGPAIIDGDFEAATATGATPGFMALGQALQQNPGNPSVEAVASSAAGNASQNWGDLTQVEQQLSQARSQAIPEVMDPSNPVAQQALQGSVASGPPIQSMQQNAGTTNSLTSSLAPVPDMQSTSTAGGIDTGMQTMSGTQTQTQQPLEQLMKQLAGQLGMNEADLWKMSGAGNMTPAYSKEAMANAPVIQALKNGANSMAQFRTAGVGTNSTASPTAASTGPGLGLRGGQDMNAGLLVNSGEGTQGLIQGAAMADGHYWPDFMAQSFKASPITQYDVGAFGRRRN